MFRKHLKPVRPTLDLKVHPTERIRRIGIGRHMIFAGDSV